MPSLPADGNRKPNDAEQAEFQRQFEILVKQHKSYTSIVTWVRTETIQDVSLANRGRSSTTRAGVSETGLLRRA
jgi:hypothetical protein